MVFSTTKKFTFPFDFGKKIENRKGFKFNNWSVASFMDNVTEPILMTQKLGLIVLKAGSISDYAHI